MQPTIFQCSVHGSEAIFKKTAVPLPTKRSSLYRSIFSTFLFKAFCVMRGSLFLKSGPFGGRLASLHRVVFRAGRADFMRFYFIIGPC